MSKAKKPGKPGQAGMPAIVTKNREATAALQTQTVRRLNVRALIILAVLVLVVIPGFLALKALQARWGQPTRLAEARKQMDARRFDLALGHLNGYLELEPNDVEALDLKSQVLADSARDDYGAKAALPAHTQVLALDPKRQAVRKRLIQLYLRAHLYNAAETAAREYLKQGADDAEAYRLLGHALEGVAFLGETAKLDEAIVCYEKSEQKQPGNVLGAERLALLYRSKTNDSVKALRVMDSLLKNNPKSVPVRLARFRFFATSSDKDAVAKALKEIDEAIKLDPTDTDSRLVAAEAASQRGDSATAREHLAAIKPELRNDIRVKLIEGLVDLGDARTESAILNWRQGLIQTGGSDADLTWRLANILLQLNRVREAEPLINQYRRLVGDVEPPPNYRYLVGVSHLKTGRAAEAVGEFEAIRYRIDKSLEGQFHYTRGQAYEAVRESSKALEAYRIASNTPGTGAMPWLSIARLLVSEQPAEAINTLERGLVTLGEEPRLLIYLSQILIQQEIAKPRDRQSWNEALAVLARAEKIQPDSADVALIRADYLAAIGRLEEGLKLLENATLKNPKASGLWFARINGLGRLGRTDEALAVIDRAVKAAGENSVFRTTQAYLLALRGEPRTARTVLNEALNRVPVEQKPAVWKALGEFHHSQSDFPAARKAFQEWARIQPDSPEARLALLNLSLKLNDKAGMDAEIAALKTIGGPTSLFWKIARAEVLLHLRTKGSPTDADAFSQIEEADKLIREIKASVPRQPAGHLLEARLLDLRERPDDAIAAYQTALDLPGGRQVALQPLVLLLTRLRRSQDLEALRERMPAFPPELERLSGALTLQIGDSDKAEQMAKRLVEGDPKSLDARVWQARVLSTLGKPREAEETLNLLIRQRPQEPGPWLQLLMFQVGRKEIPAASATLDRMRVAVRTERPELLWASCYRVLGKQSLADEMFAAAIRLWPDDQRVRQAAVDFYETIGRSDAAEASLRHVLKLNPNLDWARRTLALNLSSRAGDINAWNEALQLAGETPDGTESPDDRLLRATVLSRSIESRHRQEAVRSLEKLADDLPNSSRLQEILARSLLADGQKAKAVEYARKAAIVDDAGPDAILLHAGLALGEKNVDEAERQLTRLIAIDPNALPAIELGARILKAKGQDVEATAQLERTFEARKLSADAQVVGQGILRILISLKDYEAAERIGRQVALQGPKGQIAFAEFLGSRGRLKEAKALYDAAFKAGASGEVVRSALALAGAGSVTDREWLGETDNLLSLALQGRPDSVELLQAQAYLRHLQGRYEEEIKLYLAIIAHNPNNYVFMNNMAWTLSEELNRPEEGLDRVNEAIKRLGLQPHVLDTRGVVLLRLNRVEEAIKDLETAASAISSGPIYYHLARAYLKAGRQADYESYRVKARESGLRPEQLQPSEREEADKLVGFETSAKS